MPYTIAYKPKEKLPYWIIPPSGSEDIASGCKHSDRARAEKHMTLLNAFFDKQESKKCT